MTLLTDIHHFVDSTADFECNVRAWAKAKIDVMALERVLAVAETKAPAEVESVKAKLERAKEALRRYEFEIGEVVDNIAPAWKEMN